MDNQPINQLHGSDSLEEAEREINFFFPQQRTLAVIKPDAVAEHKGHFNQFLKAFLICFSPLAGSNLNMCLALCDSR